MIGRARFKRNLKRTAGWAAVATQYLSAGRNNQTACIFYYHRVAEVGFLDHEIDDWNVTPRRFARQIEELAKVAAVVPLNELLPKLSSSRTGDKPLVCLTFDDGYANFFTEALPVLKRFSMPATAFVVTGSIGAQQPLPFDHWALRNQSRADESTWRPMNWQELETCVASGLITVGAHSHTHQHGSKQSPDELVEEAEISGRLLRERLGEPHGRAFAYPYGNTRLGDVSEEYIKAVQTAGFRLALTTDLGVVSPGDDPFALPRLEAHMMDSPKVITAKAHGAIAPYRLADHFREAPTHN